jgi:hypothetical protein
MPILTLNLTAMELKEPFFFDRLEVLDAVGTLLNKSKNAWLNILANFLV